MLVERWKRYDARYSVSNLGHVRDGKRIAKQWIDARELWAVTIHGRPRRTAMIVGAVWLNLKPGQIVFYRRGIDCRVSNLYTAKHLGRRRWNARLTVAKARTIARSNLSISELATQYDVSRTCIARCRRGETWSHATGIKAKARTAQGR